MSMYVFCGEPRSVSPMGEDTGVPLATGDGGGRGAEEHH